MLNIIKTTNLNYTTTQAKYKRFIGKISKLVQSEQLFQTTANCDEYNIQLPASWLSPCDSVELLDQRDLILLSTRLGQVPVELCMIID